MKYIALLIFVPFFVGCGFFGKTSDRDDWWFVMDHNQYYNHQSNMVHLDTTKSQAKTVILYDKKIQEAVNLGDGKRAKFYIAEKKKYLETASLSFGGAEGLVFSGSSRRELYIYRKGDLSTPVLKVAFNENKIAHPFLHNGSYISFWKTTGGRMRRGEEFDVRPGKMVYYDGKKVPWYCGWP